jgi:hypothetical protein
MIKYFEGMRCENEHLDLISFSKDELRYHGYIDIYSDDMPYIPYQNFTDFLLEYLSKEDLADIIAANLPKNINPLLLCAFYNFNLIDRDFLTQYLAKILDSGDRKMKNDAERVAERYYSSEEMMSLIPQRFHAIKEIVKKIQIDFSLWAVDSFGTYDGDNDITNSTKLLFSIVSNDAIWIGIQHYPDLARYFTWIIETLGKLNSNVKIELELASTNVFSLPENTPIIPQEFTLRIYDYSTDKIYKKNMNSSFEEVSK